MFDIQVEVSVNLFVKNNRERKGTSRIFYNSKTVEMSKAGQYFPFYIYDEDGTNRRENITDDETPIVDLIQKVIGVSLETVGIVERLSGLDIGAEV